MTFTYCKQPLVPLAVALMTGIVIGDACPHITGWLGLSVCGCLLAVGWLFRSRRPLVEQCCLLLAVVGCGAMLMGIHRSNCKFTHFSQSVCYQAIITDVPQIRGKVVQADMEVISVNGVSLKHNMRVKGVFLQDTYTGTWRPPRMGDGIEAWSTLTPPGSSSHKRRQSGHFDEGRWLRAQGYRAQAFVLPYAWSLRALHLSRLSRMDRMQMRMKQWRQQLLSQYRHNGLQGQEYTVVAAMTLGYKAGLQPSVKQVYAAAGTSHVLALSGLHLTMVFSTLLCLLQMARLNRWLAYWLALMALWSYVALVSMPVSALRSAVTLTVCAVALLLRRAHASLSALSLAAIILLVSNPDSLWDISFQLSFTAVLAIIVIMPVTDRLWHPHNRTLLWLWRCICMSVAAQLGTQPLVLYYFGQLSVYFLFSNLLVSILVYLILALSLCFFAATPLPIVQQACATLLRIATRLLNTGLESIASLPGAHVEGIAFSQVQVVLLYVGVACLVAAADRLSRAYSKTNDYDDYWERKMELMKPKSLSKKE